MAMDAVSSFGMGRKASFEDDRISDLTMRFEDEAIAARG
jgi:hypothetical protein